jgi:ABC-2 type transport system permease protein
MSEANAIMAISFRDLMKLLRDPARMAATFIFPLLFIGVLGGSLRSNFGMSAGYDFLPFVFTGVLAQTLFQSTALGVISLIEDRENDFSQEMFVSPISRYSIIFGKILGETLVAFPQGAVIVIFGLLVGVPISVPQLLGLLVVGPIICLFGGAFGVVMLASFNSQRTANQVFPFIVFPQFFTAGVFTPIKVLPPFLEFLSRISPLRYAVDLTRNMFYVGQPDYANVALDSPAFNTVVMALMFAAFLLVGTALFVRNERNR